MTVRDLITALGQFDPDATVCLADWNEQFRDPSERAAESLTCGTSPYYATDGTLRTGYFVCLGSD